MLWGLVLQWMMRREHDLTLWCSFSGFFFGKIFLNSFKITPKTNIQTLDVNVQHLHTNIHNSSSLTARVYPGNRNSDFQLTSTTGRPATHIRFIIGGATFARSTMLVSGQRVFFPYESRVSVRIGGYFLSSLSLCRKLLIQNDSSMDGWTEIHLRVKRC